MATAVRRGQGIPPSRPSRASCPNPPATAARACPSATAPLNWSVAIFERTNPAVRAAGFAMIAQHVGSEAGPTARNLAHHPESTREMFPCAPQV